MTIDFESVGKMAIDKAIEYQNALHAHDDIIREQQELNETIIDAERKGNEKELEKLYEKYRDSKRDERANDSYRQNFCESFLSELFEISKKVAE